MKTIKVYELTGTILDWAVAKCEGVPLVLLSPFKGVKNFVMLGQNMKPTSIEYTPTKSWAQGGPIIERETLEIVPICPGTWQAIAMTQDWYNGRTPLEAAMRCYVASKLGDEIEIPDELCAKLNLK
jgi:Protein of unknown function (DUF2591)